MSPVELHLAMNHLPVLGLPFAAGLLGAGIVLDNAEWRRAGLWAAALAAVAAWGVYYGGGLAADAVGGRTGFDDHDIAAHAAAAWRFAWAASAAGVSAAAALRNPSRRASAAVLAVLLAASAAGAWTAHLGGRVRHSEIR